METEINSKEAFQIALNALERLVEKEGKEARFPFDKIWEYADKEIPGVLKPAQQRPLFRGDYIEKTGRTIKAVSQARAGSPTTEYRPGRKFRLDSPPSISDTSKGSDAEKLVAEVLKNIEENMAAAGFIITAEQLANFYLALKTSPLVILAGTSGTGKSWLPRLFTKLVGGDFASISVQPQWSDNADLFGYTPSLAPDTFIEGKFTQAIIRASKNPDAPAVVLLDEMNLAAVEHYFSDFLSVIETRRKEGGNIWTDPLPLDLPQPKNPDTYENLRNLRLLPNVRVIGTANMDETTQMFSPKVLDRAFSIEFNDVDLTAFIEPDGEKLLHAPRFASLGKNLIDSQNPVSVSEVYASSRDLFDRVAGLAEEIKNILKPGGISFGYRTRDAICLYMWHWEHDKLAEILPITDALDLCILQKILPKISGTGENLRQAIETLQDWLLHAGTAKEVAGALPSEERPSEDSTFEETPGEVVSEILSSPYKRSAEKIARMLQKLNDEGAVTYWGA